MSSTFDDLTQQRLPIGGLGSGANAPASPVAPLAQAPAPAPVAAPAPAPAAPGTVVPVNQQLQRNPQLPQHPLGAYTDAQYEAQNAALKSNIARQYADILQQLGYIDPQTGQFIMGSVETDANRQKGLLNRSMGLADEDVTNQHQQLGTLFSGLRGTDQARAEFPFTDQLGQLAVQTPLTLSGLYEKAAGLTNDYTIQDNQLLADAAARQAAGLSTPGAGGTGGTGGDPPPPPPPGPDGTGLTTGPTVNPSNIHTPGQQSTVGEGVSNPAVASIVPSLPGISTAATNAFVSNARKPGVQM